VTDIRKRDVAKALQGGTSGPSAETVIDVAMIGATLAGAFTVAPGFTSPGEAAMLALNVLFSANTPRIAKENVVFGWMPYEMAATPETAAEKALELVDVATRAAFKGYALETVTVAATKDAGGYSLDRFEYLAYAVKGGDCSDADCVLLQVRPSGMRDYYVVVSRPVEQKAPEWLGGYRAWLIKGVLFRELRVNGDYVSQLYAGKLSRELPNWLYLSLAPEGNFISAFAPLNKGQKLPLLYNEGKPMATVFPEIEFRADPDAALKLVRPKAPTPAEAAK
jgi:hypothetical protein